ncbi:hypothetical protein [Natronorubrum tibetense]|uniref:Uncharacterized protein n=1 Tax=Natronorubrum tibetense GA33 TaxID=1114856 RepID=L9W8E1_9EURY|nr:hypothetical protein [Natronorubrum tibetense]ELY45785.1 hypothetical protein C496_02547 [Natronorubrum tibetense GA33]
MKKRSNWFRAYRSGSPEIVVVAGLAALGLRSQSSLGKLLETRVGRGIVAAFESPERVENESQQDEEDTGRTSGNIREQG